MTELVEPGRAFKKELASKIRAQQPALAEWQRRHAELAPPPFYCSVDLRDAGYKITPVDSNLFPAGFNNICPEDQRTSAPILRAQILEQWKHAGFSEEPRRILIIPESHTSNLFYIENLYYLHHIATDAGFEVEIGWFPSLSGEAVPAELRSESGKVLKPRGLTLTPDHLDADGFVADLILLNNDFSSGYPRSLDSIQQLVIPSHTLGWHTRKKSEHFKYYNQLAREFADIIGCDPWMIQIDTDEVGPVNFNDEIGIEETAKAVDALLARTHQAYASRGITRAPFAYVKNNAGTYGMGILVAHSGDEIRQMNRRSKNKMSVGKNRMAIESVAIQEGVPTATLVDRLPSEPVIYLMGRELIGGFLRTNTQRGDEDNLNSQGMVFRKLCMSDLRSSDSQEENGGTEESELELVYGSIARISALATGQELLVHARQSAH